ncbi:MAG: DUF2950 domain-containing protein [Terriglobales bacterium]|jgi:hypothetical protein
MLLKTRRTAIAVRIVLLAIIIPLAACNKTDKSILTKVFSSPDDAGNALMEVGKSGDQNALLEIFGQDSKEIIFTGDPAQDKRNVELFMAGYQQMHRWRTMADGSEVLLLGVDNFAFPIPLKKNSGGQWYFDAAAGKDEILSRRIGRDELAVIDVCTALVDAQNQYFSQGHDGAGPKQYAQKFISDPGKQNGLYWDSPEGQPKSPLGPLVAFATAEGLSVKPNSHIPFHGYYFRILTKQGSQAPGGAKDYMVNGKMAGGFAFVAYPALYGNSGIMTFVVNHDGLLLQKDLGKTTAEIAAAMTEYNPDNTWSGVGE